MKNDIALIIPYFGKFPKYLKEYLYSTIYNPEIDFLFFTDDKTIFKYKLGNNVKITIESFTDFKKRIEKIVNFPIELSHPYKLCDFRPAYGEILSIELKDYKYWGFGDIDMILGDISKYISKPVSENYDRIYNLGALSFISNTEKMNTLYRRKLNYSDCLSYKYVFKNDFGFYFDETGVYKYGYGQSTVANRLSDIKLYKNFDCADIKPQKYNFELFDSNQNIDYIEFDKGKIYGIRDEKRVQEYVYAHYQKRKFTFDSNINQNHFYIGPSLISSNKNKIILNTFSKKEKYIFDINKVKRLITSKSKKIKSGAIQYAIKMKQGKINA